jgi:phosphatidylinositol-3-phosphatase
MRNLKYIFTTLLGALALSIGGCANTPGAGGSTTGGAAQPLPHFDHIVVVIEENHGYGDIIGSGSAPYINGLAQQGALFTDAHAITHPSEPNYLALFAGSTFELNSDDCPQSFTAPNLADVLTEQNHSFTGYSESMSVAGFTGCADGGSSFNPLYARKHNPWVNFADVPTSENQPFTSFPADYTQLPSVAFVVPNEQNDMHSGSVSAADSWLQQNMDGYAQWAATHNSLLIVTWDEDDGSAANQIPLIFAGAHIHSGHYNETVNHYDVLRTIEAIEGATFTGQAAQATTIADVWQA